MNETRNATAQTLEALRRAVADVDRQIGAAEYAMSIGMRMSRDLGRAHYQAALDSKTPKQYQGEADLAISLYRKYLDHARIQYRITPTI